WSCVLFVLYAASPSSLYSLSLHDALPISDSLLDVRVAHVSDDGFAGNAQSGGDVPEFSIPVRGLVQVHEVHVDLCPRQFDVRLGDRKSTRLNSSHVSISYAVFCLKKKTKN